MKNRADHTTSRDRHTQLLSYLQLLRDGWEEIEQIAQDIKRSTGQYPFGIRAGQVAEDVGVAGLSLTNLEILAKKRDHSDVEALVRLA